MLADRRTVFVARLYVLGGAPARFLAFDPDTGTWDGGLPNHPEAPQVSPGRHYHYTLALAIIGGHSLGICILIQNDSVALGHRRCIFQRCIFLSRNLPA